MEIEHGQYLKLQAQLQDHFDGRYRRIDDCERTVDPIKQNLTSDYTRLAVIEQQNKLMLWLLAAVGGGVIAMLIKMFFGQS